MRVAACEVSGPIENFQVTVGFKVRLLEHHQYHLLEKLFLRHQLRFTRQDYQEASLCPYVSKMSQVVLTCLMLGKLTQNSSPPHS